MTVLRAAFGAALCLLAAAAGPDGDKTARARIELGRRLFYDADLSRDGTISCASCHDHKHAFTTPNKTREGVSGAPGRRNAMALANVGAFTSLTWASAKVTRLEDQVAIPVMGDHPVEMGMKGMDGELAARLRGDSCYRAQFAAAFPEDSTISMTSISEAIAAFERTLISRDTQYDRYLRGEAKAISPAAARGSALFFSAKLACASCHAGPYFTDAAGAADPLVAFHAIGPAQATDLGLQESTRDVRDAGRFRTPSLRNVALTAPYLHDGAAASLPDAVRAHAQAPAISEAEMGDLVAFLEALSDRRFIANPALSLPKRNCGKAR
jgi:cytochrome c peroxidase